MVLRGLVYKGLMIKAVGGSLGAEATLTGARQYTAGAGRVPTSWPPEHEGEGVWPTKGLLNQTLGWKGPLRR